jgi:hypothetical protein
MTPNKNKIGHWHKLQEVNSLIVVQLRLTKIKSHSHQDISCNRKESIHLLIVVNVKKLKKEVSKNS